MALSVGNKAPDFELKNQNDEIVRLRDKLGKRVILYFYPRDNTPGCTTEACGLRDKYKEFKDRGVEILGISTDSTLSHQNFKKKYELPFDLLADADKMVSKLYDVWHPKKFMGKEFMGIVRTTFLISSEGIIDRVFEKVNVLTHANDILRQIKEN